MTKLFVVLWRQRLCHQSSIIPHPRNLSRRFSLVSLHLPWPQKPILTPNTFAKQLDVI